MKTIQEKTCACDGGCSIGAPVTVERRSTFEQQDDDRQIHPAWGSHAGGLVVYL